MTDTLGRIRSALSDRYEIRHELGRGGTATVYLADDRKHGRKVAIKVLHPDVAASIGPDRFLREIEIAARLHHPHILALFDSGRIAATDTDAELLYYVMPHAEGESLRDRMSREGPLPVAEAVRIACEVADALEYAHERGIIHRDIKPANILLEGGHALVSDFGIARAVTSADTSRLTGAGVAIGTTAYMSPEQAAGDDTIDGRSDTYSLACVLYEMLAGEPPHTGPTTQVVLARKMGQPAPSVRVIRETVSPALDRVLAKALARTPADRFQTAAAFQQALGTAGSALPSSSTGPAAAAATPSRRGVRTSGFAMLAIALAIIGWNLFSERIRPVEPSTTVSAAEPGVAVLPFRTTDPELDFWHEGMPVLLSANLDGITGLRKIDPVAVLNTLRADGMDEPDEIEAGTALDVAARVGASLAIRGSVVRTGNNAHLVQAEVHDVVDRTSLGSLRVEAPADSPTVLVDRLTIALLEAGLLPVRQGADTVDLAGVLTASVPALQAYIEGERKYRRGQWRDAIQDYQRAIDFDSTFAHAYDRIARAYGWIGRSSSEYEALAIRWAHRLPPREAALLRASASWLPDAIDSLEAFTNRYPDDSDGWAVFGDKQFHMGGVTLRPTTGFRSALERALELQPNVVESYQHLIENAFQHMDSAEARRLIARYAELVTESCGPGVVHDLVWGDSAARAAAMTVLDTIIPGAATNGCVQSPLAGPRAALDRLAGVYERFLDNPAVAINSTPLGSFAPVVLMWRFLQVRIPRGRIADARQVLAREMRQPVLRKPIARWQMMLHLSIRPDPAEARSAVAVLEREPDSTDNFWIGALAVAEGRWADVENTRAAIQAQSRDFEAGIDSVDDPGMETRVADAYAAVLDAWAGLERGETNRLADFESALSYLMPASYTREQPHQFLRYRVGTLLLERGDLDNAERYFRSFQPYDYFYTSQAEYYLGRIQELRGNRNEASDHYARFITWWQDADEDVAVMLNEAREALVRLRGDSG